MSRAPFTRRTETPKIPQEMEVVDSVTSGPRMPSRDSKWVILAVGIGIGLVFGLLIEGLVLSPSSPHAGTVSSPPATVPSGLPPVSTCFGGGYCNGTAPTTNGSGTACQIPGFSETAGDFLYVAINYMNGTDLIASVSDGGVDSFSYIGGEFANDQSVAFYDVPSDHGGEVTVTVTISQAEFGACTVGQLSPDTKVGSIGTGASVANWSSLTVSNPGSQSPSLLLALFGSTRPTGDPIVATFPPNGTVWNLANQWTGSTYDGTAQVLCGEDDLTSGTVLFTWSTGNGQIPSISGISVQFYLAS